jgi:hypothetical protein
MSQIIRSRALQEGLCMAGCCGSCAVEIRKAIGWQPAFAVQRRPPPTVPSQAPTTYGTVGQEMG